MMFAKTFCKPGAYMCVVPLGLRATLQYSSKGVLEKVILGYEDDCPSANKEMFDTIVTNNIVPTSIHLIGGTTWVQGVFYTHTEFSAPGHLPECVENDMLDNFKDNPIDYHFYACNISSLAASFQSIRTIDNWLSMAHFDVLPGRILPAQVTDAVLSSIVKSLSSKFKYPLISGVMLWQGGNMFYEPCNLSQFIVSKVVKEVDENGYIKGHIYNSEGQRQVTVPFSDIVTYNIQANDNVVYDNASYEILYAISTDNKYREKRSSIDKCTICGKPITIPDHGPVICDDPHCLSLQYPNVKHLLNVLNLPELSFEKYVKYVKKGDILCLTDVLLLPEYHEYKLEIPLASCLKAVTPLAVCNNSNFFTLVAARCAESIKTLKYYLANPNRLQIELDLNSLECIRWINWLQDAYNAKLIENIIECNQISITKSYKLFEGAPIFRDKTIAITGRFKHGDLSEVIGILESYSAKVVTSVDDNAGCLVVGSLNEDIDGKCIKAANERNIPVFEEDAFFAEYDIDSDLAQNLLYL